MSWSICHAQGLGQIDTCFMVRLAWLLSFLVNSNRSPEEGHLVILEKRDGVESRLIIAGTQ